VLAAIAAVVIGGRYATRPVFRYIAAARLREIFTAAALLLVVGVAVLMQAVGLSPALGAFLAGVVLAESEFRRELETDIEPFRGLLLGLFFITVGAALDFGLIAVQPLLIAGLVSAMMVLTRCLLAMASRARALADAATAAVVLSQGGEFAFVLSPSRWGGVLGQPWPPLLTAVVALRWRSRRSPTALVPALAAPDGAGARQSPSTPPAGAIVAASAASARSSGASWRPTASDRDAGQLHRALHRPASEVRPPLSTMATRHGWTCSAQRAPSRPSC
jgi:glutathione-regulated potassium-efflux system ancillary protein KefC/glutathione-regulated potassium-efflux system protein KefB